MHAGTSQFYDSGEDHKETSLNQLPLRAYIFLCLSIKLKICGVI